MTRELKVTIIELAQEFAIRPGGGTDRDARRFAILITHVILCFVGSKRRRDNSDAHSISLVQYYKLYGPIENYLFQRAKEMKIICLPIPQEENSTTNKSDPLSLHSVDMELNEEDQKFIDGFINLIIGEENEEN